MIKFWSIFLLLTVVPVTAIAQEAQTPERWTASVAVDYALRNSPDSSIAAARIREAEAFLTQASVGFFPQVGLSGGYSQTNNPMYSFGNILNQGSFSPAIDFNDPGRTDNFNLTAGITYRFYNGGQDRAHKEAAGAGVEASQSAREAVRLQLGFEAYRSFQRIVDAENILRARTAALEAIRASLSVARARFDAGDLLKVEMLNLEVQESRALENQIQAEHDLRLAEKVFLQLLGLSDREVQIEAADAGPRLPKTVSAERRPELQRLSAALLAAEAQVTAARGGRLPTVDGFASYQYDKGTVIDGNGDSWMAGVKVDFKLFDGHKVSSDIALAEAQLAKLRAEKRKLELALELEITRARLALDQALQRRRVTRKMVEQAAESESLSQAQFRAGVILSSDLIDSENRLTDARVRNVIASSAEQIAIADLRRAAGLPLFHDLNNDQTTQEN